MPDHAPLSLREKVLLATRVWVRFALVSIRVRRQPLPRLVARLTAVDGGPPRRHARTGDACQSCGQESSDRKPPATLPDQRARPLSPPAGAGRSRRARDRPPRAGGRRAGTRVGGAGRPGRRSAAGSRRTQRDGPSLLDQLSSRGRGTHEPWRDPSPTGSARAASPRVRAAHRALRSRHPSPGAKDPKASAVAPDSPGPSSSNQRFAYVLSRRSRISSGTSPRSALRTKPFIR